MKQMWTVVALFAFLATAQGQSQEKQRGFAKRVIFGTSLTYKPIYDEPIAGFILHELTWSTNASISVTKKIHIGWSYKYIHASGSLSGIDIEPDNYFAAGMFGQYDFLQYDKLRIYGQVNYDYGNYCTCELPRLEPSKVPGIHYAGLGLGLTYRLAKYISADLAWETNLLLNMREFMPYPYLYYILGVNIDIER